MNTARVFCGISVTVPQRRTSAAKPSNNSRTSGRAFANSASSEKLPHECHWCGVTNSAPHCGQRHNGRSFFAGMAGACAPRLTPQLRAESRVLRRCQSPICYGTMALSAPDLDAYFARLGYTGPREATLSVLHAIHLGHVLTFPFENLDVLLGRGISLEDTVIAQKFLHARRGGYCFEQNGLLEAVLRALGFRVTPLIARVRWQAAPGVATPQSHKILRIDLDGRPWLADAGFGGIGLVEPLALDTDAEQGPPHEARRLVADGHFLTQQFRVAGEWLDVYRFTLDEAAPIDFEVANWYTSTHPQSRFRQNLIVALAQPDRRLALFNRELTTRYPDGRVEKSAIDTPDDLLAILAEPFGLHFPAGTRFGPPGSPWPS